jgi:hypothetical protein
MEIDPVFIGEVGVHEGLMHYDDYDRYNPDGSAWGRRNYDETAYLSGDRDEPRDGSKLYHDYYH